MDRHLFEQHNYIKKIARQYRVRFAIPPKEEIAKLTNPFEIRNFSQKKSSSANREKDNILFANKVKVRPLSRRNKDEELQKSSKKIRVKELEFIDNIAVRPVPRKLKTITSKSPKLEEVTYEGSKISLNISNVSKGKEK